MPIIAINLHTLSRHWRVILLRGVASLLFGLGALLLPGVSLAVLVLAFGAYACVDGVLAFASGFENRASRGAAGALMLEGALGVAAGIFTFVWPGITALVLTLVVGAWALLTGLLEIVLAVRLRKVMAHEWLLAASGFLSVVLAVCIFAFPRAGALALVMLLGAYAFTFGALLVALSLRLRAWGKPSGTGEPAPLSWRPL